MSDHIATFLDLYEYRNGSGVGVLKSVFIDLFSPSRNRKSLATNKSIRPKPGSNTTNRILDVLEEKRPKIICIDELDKMPRPFQEKLLNLIESGHIKVDQMRKQYDFRIRAHVVLDQL